MNKLTFQQKRISQEEPPPSFSPPSEVDVSKSLIS